MRLQNTVAESVEGGVKISKMGPREREEGGFGDLQPVMKKLKLGEGEKREIEDQEDEKLKGEGRGVKRRHHPDTECTGTCLHSLYGNYWHRKAVLYICPRQRFPSHPYKPSTFSFLRVKAFYGVRPCYCFYCVIFDVSLKNPCRFM